jgi:hypothetical protein
MDIQEAMMPVRNEETSLRRRIAVNIARLPELLGKADRD